ncbi:MAG: hypothetical protein LBN33_10010 [Desulfovibrio sp.]|jgi:hypothetical protein|nr:hypothetical protein [Desulfovibrio sp.]
MYSTLPTATHPEHTLILAASDSAVRMDVKILRSIGTTRLTYARSPVEAVAVLRRERSIRAQVMLQAGEISACTEAVNGVDLLLCDDRATDQPLLSFLYELAGETDLNTQPVLALTGDAAVFATLRAAGVSALLRPYSVEQMRQATQKAMSPMRQALRPEAFAAAIARKPPARKKDPQSTLAPSAKKDGRHKKAAPDMLLTSELFNKGRWRLKHGDEDGAETIFLEVLQRQRDHTGALLGLARVCRARDNADGMHKWLIRAAASCQRAGDKERLNSITELLPDRLRRNIFVHEAIGRLQDGAYRDAALSFLDAEKADGEIPLHRLVARACLMTAHPDGDMRKLCEAIYNLGFKSEAISLQKRLLDYRPLATADAASWVDSFPLLKDALNVASYTIWAWKQA